MPSVFNMSAEEARRLGERLVTSLTDKFRQDSRNARFIGRFSVEGLVAKSRSNVEQWVNRTRLGADSEIAVASQPHEVIENLPDFAILSSDELLRHLEVCSPEEAQTILDYEQGHLDRSAVVEAARLRVGQ